MRGGKRWTADRTMVGPDARGAHYSGAEGPRAPGGTQLKRSLDIEGVQPSLFLAAPSRFIGRKEVKLERAVYARASR